MRLIPRWIMIVSAVIALGGTFVGISLYLFPGTFIPGIDFSANGAGYLAAMWGARQIALAGIVGYSLLRRSSGMLSLSLGAYCVMNIQDAAIGYQRGDASLLWGAAFFTLLSGAMAYIVSRRGRSLSDEEGVRRLYRDLLDAWNARDAAGMAALCHPDGSLVGYDGSQMNGRETVRNELGAVFASHKTAAYVSLVRDVRVLAPGFALLRSVAGMIPDGGMDINPAVNAVQTLVATHADAGWRVLLFQNTPAAFHGRPELAERLTGELRAAYRNPNNSGRPT